MQGHRFHNDIGSLDFTAAFPSHILPRPIDQYKLGELA